MNITELCVNCKQNNSCTMRWKTSKKKCPHFIQKTNADRIRAMSDDELAIFMADKPICPKPMEECRFNCSKCWDDWLKQPVEVE